MRVRVPADANTSLSGVLMSSGREMDSAAWEASALGVGRERGADARGGGGEECRMLAERAEKRDGSGEEGGEGCGDGAT